MKYIKLFFLTVLFFSCGSDSPENKVLNLAVKDYKHHSYYLALRVQLDSVIVPCVIENGNLYFFFRKGRYDQESV